MAPPKALPARQLFNVLNFPQQHLDEKYELIQQIADDDRKLIGFTHISSDVGALKGAVQMIGKNRISHDGKEVQRTVLIVGGVSTSLEDEIVKVLESQNHAQILFMTQANFQSLFLRDFDKMSGLFTTSVKDQDDRIYYPASFADGLLCGRLQTDVSEVTKASSSFAGEISYDFAKDIQLIDEMGVTNLLVVIDPHNEGLDVNEKGDIFDALTENAKRVNGEDDDEPKIVELDENDKEIIPEKAGDNNVTENATGDSNNGNHSSLISLVQRLVEEFNTRKTSLKGDLSLTVKTSVCSGIAHVHINDFVKEKSEKKCWIVLPPTLIASSNQAANSATKNKARIPSTAAALNAINGAESAGGNPNEGVAVVQDNSNNLISIAATGDNAARNDFGGKTSNTLASVILGDNNSTNAANTTTIITINSLTDNKINHKTHSLGASILTAYYVLNKKKMGWNLTLALAFVMKKLPEFEVCSEHFQFLNALPDSLEDCVQESLAERLQEQ